ncbi:MAG: glucuronate isomerase [Limnochordia bacterium]|jgi:hypothetical protein
MPVQDLTQLRSMVERTVAAVPIMDVHTHLFSPSFGEMLLWGFDELVCYHYLIAETMRAINMPYEQYWAMSRKEQADLIWQTLFIDNSPYSEACRGVLTVLDKLGLDVASRDVNSYREYFKNVTVEEYVDRVFAVANLESVVMTNDPFDPTERIVWQQEIASDPRFLTALRIDPLLIAWERSYEQLAGWGYGVDRNLTAETLSEVRRFLSDWIKKINPVYMAVSLSADFVFPDESVQAKLMAECVLPVAREFNIPFALMIGVKRQVNPGLRVAGDGIGKADIKAVEYLCAHYPHNKFLVTMLARENQHELAVTARKFRNLHIFGCWWFLNNPSLIEEMTRMRFELLGLGVTPQHSDARVLDQVIYKWSHSREIIGRVLADKYCDIARTGWQVTEAEVRRDVQKLFGGGFREFLQLELG